ncbi:MAG TPA: SDR family NAD(P)-dependent oxidoreductase [Acetobacteraceae bacterium]|nr:SDR family NAD(P)-dependent oxidoreductase [Acetobacteraceae bacterium]
MEIAGKVVVVTGAGSGIGRELARRAHREGAAHVAVADLNEAGAQETASAIGATARAFACDVSNEADIQRLVRETESSAGPIGLFCSNAGVAYLDPDFDNAASLPNELWQRSWDIHVMAHVYAARAVLPGMIERKSGWLLNTVSAAGLLSQIGAAVYATTKHAAIGFAESLAITHKDHGIGVSVLCPQGVATGMTAGGFFAGADVDGVMTPEQCVDAAIAGLRAGTFCILPHPAVADYVKLKAENYDRWIGGMAKLRRRVAAAREGR